jgi:hypothetical protein
MSHPLSTVPDRDPDAENPSRAAGDTGVSGEGGLLLDGVDWEVEGSLVTNERIPLVMLFDALCVFLLGTCSAAEAPRFRVLTDS